MGSHLYALNPPSCASTGTLCSVLPECSEQRDNQVWSRHVFIETSEAPGGPSRRMRCLMSGPVASLWPRGRPDDATNAPPGEPPGTCFGTLLSSLEPAQRFHLRPKRYPQYRMVRGMDSELWRRRRRPISSAQHVLLTTAPWSVPAARGRVACSERDNKVWNRLCASARVY
jgi:hypothetical protein